MFQQLSQLKMKNDNINDIQNENMFNESWEGKDLAGFINTTLAQQIQKSKIGQFADAFGISSLLSTVSKKTSEENALKIADGTTDNIAFSIHINRVMEVVKKIEEHNKKMIN